MDTGISPRLDQFYLPPIEQLSMAPAMHRCGVMATLDADHGTGGVWVSGIGEDCLFSALDLTLSTATELAMDMDDYLCLGSMSHANVLGTPIAGHDAPRILENNLVSYSQSKERFSYVAEGGVKYASRSFCMTKRFFDRITTVSPEDGRLLIDYLSTPSLNQLPPEIAWLLDSIGSRDVDRPGMAFRLASILNTVLSIMVESASAQQQAEARAGSISSQSLVRSAFSIMEANLSERITLDSLAGDLCVSRASLAATFKRETGTSVGEALRNLRMDRAAALLGATSMSIAEVGRCVGYARQSSFTEAFKRHFGMSPLQWRSLR